MAGYTPLFGSIVTSSIWNEDSETRIVWITMLALADANGKVEGSVSGLAPVARVSLGSCEKALNRLKQPDPYSRTKEFDGRRIEDVEGGWQISNFVKFREKAKKRTAEYYRNYRQQTHTHTQTGATERNKDSVAQHVATEQEVKDIAAIIGVSDEQASRFYHHYNKKGWLDGTGQPITNIHSALVDWRNNQFKFQQPTPAAKVDAEGFTAQERYWKEQEDVK